MGNVTQQRLHLQAQRGCPRFYPLPAWLCVKHTPPLLCPRHLGWCARSAEGTQSPPGQEHRGMPGQGGRKRQAQESWYCMGVEAEASATSGRREGALWVPSPAPSRLCGSKVLSCYFYFIFKMKQRWRGGEMEKRERRDGRGDQDTFS